MVSSDSGNKLQEYTDNELIYKIKNGSNEAFELLAIKYLSVIRAKAARYNCDMLEFNDFIQEGLLGLYFAAKAYNENSGASFKTFVSLCVERRLLSLCRSTERKKNLPLKNSVSLDDDSLSLYDNSSNPEELIDDNEALSDLQSKINTCLSVKERSVLNLYLSGASYKQMACKLGISEKSVDNSLQRIRRKLRQAI